MSGFTTIFDVRHIFEIQLNITIFLEEGFFHKYTSSSRVMKSTHNTRKNTLMNLVFRKIGDIVEFQRLALAWVNLFERSV